MIGQPNLLNNFNGNYQTIGFGNYGYGIYTQESAMYRNPWDGHIGVEREVDFTPLDVYHYQPITGIPASIRQHYIS
ncbi:unnamed protein product [Adineta steineri]|uniref:Uncharacterized protein n=2 Tax=Adineta steineri TaxID=433720 RepID=A0A815MZP8_9BILA|nr:unnamed protein product [Adineta steineri]CAF1431402.1 unnamed protein product [Adineta steineri]